MIADMALVNGKIYSPDEKGNVIRGDTVLIQNGRILAAGYENEIRGQIGTSTRVIDCNGCTILPGLADAHCHPSGAVEMTAGCDLFGIYAGDGKTADNIIEQYLGRLREYVKADDKSAVIRGSGWIFGNFTGDRIPTRHDLDRVCKDRPIVLRSFCGHVLWVNSKAMEMAGVDKNTPDVQAGKIYREEDGYPAGIFQEIEAKKLIEKNLPGYALSVDEYKERLLRYQRDFANKYGVTMIQDCAYNANAVEAYRELAEEGRLTARFRSVYLMEPGKARETLKTLKERKSKDDSALDFRIDTVKIFAEGPFSLLEPYERSFIEDNGLSEDYNGKLFWDDEEFVYVASAAMKAGFNVHVHAMGDKAVKQSIACLSEAQKQVGHPMRNVVAHLMLVRDEDIEAMKRAGIIANLQPRWMVHDADIDAMERMVGVRAERCYPQRGFIDRGIKVTYGTDYPVTPPPDTMHEIQCAMTRSVFPDAPSYEKYRGKVLGDEKPATLEEAVKALSVNSAYQMLLENEAGSIETGKSADLVVLDSDLERTAPQEIYGVKVKKTIFKGKIVYEGKEEM